MGIDKINLYYNAKKGQRRPLKCNTGVFVVVLDGVAVLHHHPCSSLSVFVVVSHHRCHRRRRPCSSLSASVPGLVFACLYPLALGWRSFDVIGVLAGVGPFVVVLDGVGVGIRAGVEFRVRLPE